MVCQPPTQCYLDILSVFLPWWVNTGLRMITSRSSYTHIKLRCSLGNANRRRRLNKTRVTFSHMRFTSFHPPVKAVWTHTNSSWHAVSVVRRGFYTSREDTERFYAQRAFLSRVSLSPQSEYERGSPQTVIRLTEMGCWFGNPGELEAPRNTMTVFNQENVEDYYEIGDELGRYVMIFGR